MPAFTSAARTASNALSTSYRLRTTCPRATRISSVRNLHRSSALSAQKDAQDKDSLNPRSSEYSKTGGGDDAAAAEKTAFDPDQTRPEQEVGEANETEGANNSLNVSPGNHESSQGRDPQEGGREGSVNESQSSETSERTARSSGAGGAPKAGGGKSG